MWIVLSCMLSNIFSVSVCRGGDHRVQLYKVRAHTQLLHPTTGGTCLHFFVAVYVCIEDTWNVYWTSTIRPMLDPCVKKTLLRCLEWSFIRGLFHERGNVWFKKTKTKKTKHIGLVIRLIVCWFFKLVCCFTRLADVLKKIKSSWTSIKGQKDVS